MQQLSLDEPQLVIPAPPGAQLGGSATAPSPPSPPPFDVPDDDPDPLDEPVLEPDDELPEDDDEAEPDDEEPPDDDDPLDDSPLLLAPLPDVEPEPLLAPLDPEPETALVSGPPPSADGAFAPASPTVQSLSSAGQPASALSSTIKATARAGMSCIG